MSIKNHIVLCMTFETTTPESAAEGEYADSGFWFEREQWTPGSGLLKEMLKNAIARGCCEPSTYPISAIAHGHVSVRSVDADVNYRTGSETTYTFHIDECTPSTARRIARILARK